MKKWLLKFGFSVLLMLIVIAVQPPSKQAEAHCTPYHPHHCVEDIVEDISPSDGHPFFGPECGSGWNTHIVPDKWGVPGVAIANFAPACKEHDKCYDDQLGQSLCDKKFRRHLYRRCQYGFPGLLFSLKASCNAAAEGYYRTVSATGKSAYEKAGKKVSSSSSSGRYDRVYFENKCDRRIWTAINYKDIDDNWVTQGWWSLDSGDSAFVASTQNTIFYIYAESAAPLEPRLYWNGDDYHDTIRGSSVRYGFKQRKITTEKWGTWTESFSCN